MYDNDSRPPLLIAREMNDIRAKGNEKAPIKKENLFQTYRITVLESGKHIRREPGLTLSRKECRMNP